MEQLKTYIDTGLDLPKTVEANEKDLIIAIRVFSKANPVTKQFESKGDIIKYDVKTWEIQKKQFSNLGYEMHVLHDPRIEEEKPKVGRPAN